MLIKSITATCILAILITLYGCTPEGDMPRSKIPLTCGDLFSEYSQKPANLKFIECTKGAVDSQTLFKVKYFVANEHADEVEKSLVKNYGIMKFCNYYHSMPENSIYLQPENLLELDSSYSLVINVQHEDIEMLIYNGCKNTKDKGFYVFVSIMSI